MKELEVRIDDGVYLDLTEFYEISLKKHPALDEVTVIKKEQRLIQALKDLGKYALTDHTQIRHIGCRGATHTHICARKKQNRKIWKP